MQLNRVFQQNSLFMMKGISCGENREDSSVWIEEMVEAPENVRVDLKTGVKYGVLTVCVTCPCCDEETVRQYLFHNHLHCRVIQNMEVLMLNNQIQLYLPYGGVGCFDLTITSPYYNDSCILWIASCLNLNADRGAKGCTDAFFAELQDNFKLKSGFRRFFNVVQWDRRIRTRSTRLYCLWYLSTCIQEPSIRENIMVLAKLW